MIVEIPKNSQNKYEYDKELGIFRLDRFLDSPMHHPEITGSFRGRSLKTWIRWMC